MTSRRSGPRSSPSFANTRSREPRAFGSVARGEAGEDSDVDLVVEFEGRKSLLDLIGLKLDLEDNFHRKFDVLTYDSLHPLLKD